MNAKISVLLTLALLLLVFAGCQNAAPQLQDVPAPVSGQALAPNDTPETIEKTPAPTAETTEDKLTKDEAAQIALDHAGLKQSEVLRLKVEYDLDDGVAKYEVDFEKDRFEYSYEIHAQTGKILDADKEYDD